MVPLKEHNIVGGCYSMAQRKRFGRFLFPSMKAACQFLEDIEDVSASGLANMVGARIDENSTNVLENGGVVVRTLTERAYKLASRVATRLDD